MILELKQDEEKEVFVDINCITLVAASFSVTFGSENNFTPEIKFKSELNLNYYLSKLLVNASALSDKLCIKFDHRLKQSFSVLSNNRKHFMVGLLSFMQIFSKR